MNPPITTAVLKDVLRVSITKTIASPINPVKINTVGTPDVSLTSIDGR